MSFDFFSFWVGLVVGLVIAYGIIWFVGRAIYQRLVAAVEQQNEEVESPRIDMKVEQHGNMLYAFRADDDGFVCQGADLQDLKQQFVKLFPGHTGAFVGKTDELHRELRKQYKELNNESGSSIGSTS